MQRGMFFGEGMQKGMFFREGHAEGHVEGHVFDQTWNHAHNGGQSFNCNRYWASRRFHSSMMRTTVDLSCWVDSDRRKGGSSNGRLAARACRRMRMSVSRLPASDGGCLPA